MVRNLIGNGTMGLAGLLSNAFSVGKEVYSAFGGDTGISVKAGNYIAQEYYVEIGGKVYQTSVIIGPDQGNPNNRRLSTRTRGVDPNKELVWSRQQFIDEYVIGAGYTQIR